MTFAIDYRLVDPVADHGVYPIPELNLKAAVQYLRAHAVELGVERVVLQGHSAGARLGGIMLTTAGSLGSDSPETWSGVSDAIDGLIGFYGYYDGVQYEAEAYYGGDGTAPRTAISTARAGWATAPVLLDHGVSDGILGANRSTAFADALRAAGRDVTLDLVEGADHGFDGYATAALTPAGERAAETAVAWMEARARA